MAPDPIAEEIKPIDRSFAAKTHPAMYLMHKYWARKPHNIIAEYISHYTKPGDIVLDPFMGSGVTVFESLRLSRRVVGIDLNPLGVLIARATLSSLPGEEIRAAGEAVMEKTHSEVASLYATRCPKCKAAASTTHTVWGKTVECGGCGEGVNLALAQKQGRAYTCPKCGMPLDVSASDSTADYPLEVWYECTKCGRDTKKLDSGDWSVLNDIETMEVPYWYPTQELVPNSRILAYEGLRVCDLFSKRAIIVLSTILHHIRELAHNDLLTCLEFTFSSALPQASRLIAYRRGLTTGGPAWTVPGFWVPAKHFEVNALNCFRNRLQRVIRGKTQVSRILPQDAVIWARDLEALQGDATTLVACQSATNLAEPLGIPDEVIDYIFTDPPYGDSVPYMEYAIFWASWLGLSLEMSQEVVISDSPVRGKDMSEYRRLLTQAFREMYRVLKAGGWLSLTFHNREIAVWNALVTAAQDAHFEYVSDIYQVPAVVSAKQQLAREGSLTGDIVINFRKRPGVPPRLIVGDVDAEKVIQEEARQIIIERRGMATRDQLMRGIVSALMRAGALHRFREAGYIDFVLTRYFRKIGRNKWAAKEDQPASAFAYVPLDSRIRWIIESLLTEKPATLDEILVAIFTNLRNGRTPEGPDVSDVLRNIAEPVRGKWQLKAIPLPELAEAVGQPITTAEDVTSHNQILAMLARMGHRAGCLCHIARTERSQVAELNELSDIKDLVIPGLDTKQLHDSRVDQIDLIWVEHRTVPVALFEVENTTRAMTCIARMANLIELLPHLAIPTFIVGPDVLEGKMRQELRNPSTQVLAAAAPGPWYYMLYTELLKFADDVLPAELSISVQDLEKMAHLVAEDNHA